MTEEKHDPIDMMGGVSKQLPEQSDWIGAVHVLSDLFSSLEAQMTDVQKAYMIGIGALLYRQGFREMQAGIAASDVMKKMMNGDENV